MSWVRSDGADTAFTAFAGLVIVEESSRGQAWLTSLWGPERWIDAGIETAWTEVADVVEDTAADSSALYCQDWATAKVPDGCAWTYWARYGQYVIALEGGSETYPMSGEEFVRTFVAPADAYIAGRLGVG